MLILIERLIPLGLDRPFSINCPKIFSLVKKRPDRIDTVRRKGGQNPYAARMPSRAELSLL